MSESRAVLLLDHDNVPFGSVGLKSILERWLLELAPRTQRGSVRTAIVRAYGGWWKGDQLSESRQKATSFYADECPALLRVDGVFWRVGFEFADRLVGFVGRKAPMPAIHNTFVMRPVPPLKISRNGAYTCIEADCEARKLRDWFYSRRGCTRKACQNLFGDIWSRSEQKQVDIHLAIDLITLAPNIDPAFNLALATDDADFLPALLSASYVSPSPHSLSHLRCQMQPTYLDDFLTSQGVVIISV